MTIDRSQLDLTLELLESPYEEFSLLLEDFKQETASSIEKAKEAFKQGEAEGVHKTMHGLKPSLLAFGTVTLTTIVLKLEKQAQDDNLSNAGNLLAQMEKAFTQAVSDLEEIRQTLLL